MYLDHFGLKESPFSIAPNPHYLYMSRRHRDALAHLLYGLQVDGGFILLTGEVGTGKTTLCRCLLEQVPQDIDVAFVLNPKVTVPELLATICDEFGVTYEQESSAKHLVDLLNQFLLQQHALHRRSVVIIDEAQNLATDVLEQLRLLTNLETNERKLLQIILLGQPELLDILERQELRQFSQRITARFHLEALGRDETRDYISHRLQVAGVDRPIFNRAAMKEVHRLSKGIPRVVNLICDRALLGAYAGDRHSINRRIVDQAAAEVLGQRFKGWIPQAYGWAITAVLVVVVILGYTGFFRQPQTLTPSLPEVTSGQSSPEPAVMPVMQGHTSLDLAYRDLFTLWGAAFADRDTPPCELAKTIGLLCDTRVLSKETLISLNRPAIVIYRGQYLTVSHISADQLTLIAADRQYEISQQQLEQHIHGEMRLLWRPPPIFDQTGAPLELKDSGPAVDWLVIQLALLDGKEPPLEAGLRFTTEVENRVRAFQASVKLPATGRVDIDTWIHLNSAQPVGIPLLTADTQS